MTEPLHEHWALTGWDDVGDWLPFPADLVIEGELIESPDWPNRYRRCEWDPDKFDVELHATPETHRLRVCLPFQLEPLPYDGDVILGYAAVTDEGKPTRQWFEHVDGRTHMIVETLDA